MVVCQEAGRVAKETAHRIGHEGLHKIKEWLEATTRFGFSYTVWDSEPMCTRECPDGTKKALDLEGNTVGKPQERPRPVSVECKKYTTVGGQADGYREFLAVAYANAVQLAGKALQEDEDNEPEDNPSDHHSENPDRRE